MDLLHSNEEQTVTYFNKSDSKLDMYRLILL